MLNLLVDKDNNNLNDGYLDAMLESMDTAYYITVQK